MYVSPVEMMHCCFTLEPYLPGKRFKALVDNIGMLPEWLQARRSRGCGEQ